MAAESEDVAQILDVDPEQLVHLLGQSADGTAQLIDEHGNTITLTAEQFAEAGLSLQLQEGQYIQGDDGEIYIFESDAPRQSQNASVPPAVQASASAMISERMPHIQKSVPQSRPHHPSIVQHMRSHPTPSAPNADSGQQQRLLEEYRRMLRERESRLNDIERKLKETSEQNIIMAHALVNTCKSQDLEVIVQSPDGRTTKKQIVTVKKTGVGEIVPEGAYVVTGANGDTHIVSTGQQKIIADPIQPPAPYSIVPAFRRSADAFQMGFLPHPCDQCPRRFAQEAHLKRHLEMSHAKRRPFFCQFCNRDLYLPSELHFHGHMRMQHKQELEAEANALMHGPVEPMNFMRPALTTIDEVEQEPDWEVLYKVKETYTDAEVAPVEGGEFKCTLCNKEYGTMKGLKKHAKDEHNVIIEEEKDEHSDKFKCDQCDQAYSRQDFLDKHRISHTTNELAYSCQYCTDKKFRWKENLLKHLNGHMERMPFKCVFCNQGFPSQLRLDLHQKSRHGHSREGSSGMALPANQLQRDHVCPICQKSFFDKDVLTKHMRVHGGTVYPCPECDKKFISEKFLRNHMTVHTQIRDFTCEKCGKFFISSSLLKAHRYVHGERPYKCRACRRTFRRVYDLRSHEKMHTEVRTHACDVCGRNFRQKANLELHMRVHQGLKPFQCSSCRKTFSKIEHLKVHINAHEGIKSFPCSMCDKAFFTTEQLRQHLPLHEPGKKPFECGTCGRAFLKRMHLVKHLKAHTTDSTKQYLIFWEKGGILQDATIVAHSADQDASMNLEDLQQQQLEDQAHQESDRLTRMDRKQPIVLQTFQKSNLSKTSGVTMMEQDGSGQTNSSQSAENSVDTNALLAMAEAQGEDGTIYISEENMQALTDQGVIFAYQDQE